MLEEQDGFSSIRRVFPVGFPSEADVDAAAPHIFTVWNLHGYNSVSCGEAKVGIETHRRWLSAEERTAEKSAASRDLVVPASLSSYDESLQTDT